MRVVLLYYDGLVTVDTLMTCVFLSLSPLDQYLEIKSPEVGRKEMSLNLLVSTFRKEKKKSSFLYNPDEWKRFKGHGQQQVEILWFISRVISSFSSGVKKVFWNFHQGAICESSRAAAQLSLEIIHKQACCCLYYTEKHILMRGAIRSLFNERNSSHPPGRAYCCVRTNDCVQQLAPVCASGRWSTPTPISLNPILIASRAPYSSFFTLYVVVKGERRGNLFHYVIGSLGGLFDAGHVRQRGAPEENLISITRRRCPTRPMFSKDIL